MSYDDILDSLRQAYDNGAERRERPNLQPWKVAERQRLIDLMRGEGKRRLLDVGSAAGVHGQWFAAQGLEVVCTDLSPELVRRCREKDLEAYEMDFLHLDFPKASFDAIFAMNCLLHVPRTELSATLLSLKRVLKPDGLFYWGQYGGLDVEGVFAGDSYEPKRFFSRMTGTQILEAACKHFQLIEFRRIDLGAAHDGFDYQALLLRR